ncbi:MAG: peptide chain release factor N(5)-glutamine methyltransferase [Armatimonadetes bacterium]|nr:peptide chain release factor N(5)-glutamine methyltransferase [Armatimonadota bacterium]
MTHAPSVRDALNEAVARLQAAGVDSPLTDARILLAHALDVPLTRLDLLLRSPLDTAVRARFSALAAERASRRPLAYVTGYTEFMGLRFRCDERALVPRPETEVLVNAVVGADPRVRPSSAGPGRTHGIVLKKGSVEEGRLSCGPHVSRRSGFQSRHCLSQHNHVSAPTTAGHGRTHGILLGNHSVEEKHSSYTVYVARRSGCQSRHRLCQHNHGSAPTTAILDLGAGTGAIGLSLAALLPEARVILTDISSDALALARENAEALGLPDRVRFAEGPDLDPVLAAGLTEEITCVVSNPPYVALRDVAALPPEVAAHEPKPAWLGEGEAGTGVYERLIPECARYLPNVRLVALEVGLGQAATVRDLCATAWPTFDTRILKDLSGIDRVVIAQSR